MGRKESNKSRLIIAKCRSKVLQNAPREHSAILLTFIKLPLVFKTFVFSIFEWPPKTGFTVGFVALSCSVGRVLDWGWKGC